MLQIIEFNDVNDTALIDTADVTNTNVLRLEYFDWRRVSLSQMSDFVYLDMEGNSYHDTAKNIRRIFCSIEEKVSVVRSDACENKFQRLD